MKMDARALITIAPYLCSDADRIHLLQTCHEFSKLSHRIRFTDEYVYERVKNVVDVFDLVNVRYVFSINQYNIIPFINLHGFRLGTIPNGVTVLYYNSDVPVSIVSKILSQSIRHIHFEKITRIDSLPKHVGSISVPNGMSVSHLINVRIEYRVSDQQRFTPSGTMNCSWIKYIGIPDIGDVDIFIQRKN
jgi:hypothetical protein